MAARSDTVGIGIILQKEGGELHIMPCGQNGAD